MKMGEGGPNYSPPLPQKKLPIKAPALLGLKDFISNISFEISTLQTFRRTFCVAD